MAYKIAQIDWQEFFAELKNQGILGGMGVIDFPFKNESRETGSQPRLRKWFPTLNNSTMEEVMAAMYSALSSSSHCYVFVPYHKQLNWVEGIAQEVGFRVANRLMWDKVYKGMSYSWRESHEDILFLKKGRRSMNNAGDRDVLTHPNITAGYPTEKPYGLAEQIIRNSTVPHDIIIDPFMGSGVFGHAAVANYRQFIGGDINGEAFNISEKRMYRTLYEMSQFIHRYGLDAEDVKNDLEREVPVEENEVVPVTDIVDGIRPKKKGRPKKNELGTNKIGEEG